MTEVPCTVAVDVGNSAVKVAFAPEDSKAFSLGDSNWIDDLCRWVRQSNRSEFSWWVSTVNRAASEPLCRAVSSEFEGSIWRPVTHEMLPIAAEVDAPDRVGIDRLLGAYAASVRFEKPVIIVDAGSAVTVDWVQLGSRGEAVFHGGAILPGLRLQLSALASGTEGIAKTPWSFSRRAVPAEPDRGAGVAPAKNTEAAIGLGVRSSVAGGIERLVQEYARHFGAMVGESTDEAGGDRSVGTSPPTVAVTGGDAALVGQLLRIEHTVVPNLVCLGLFDLASHLSGGSPQELSSSESLRSGLSPSGLE